VASPQYGLVLVEGIGMFGVFAVGLNEFAMRAVELLVGGVGLGGSRVVIDGHAVLVRRVEDPVWGGRYLLR
jgi:hypothetical protein